MTTEAGAGDLAIGLDFGGSGIKGAVVDVLTGQLVGDRLRVPTPRPSAPHDVVAVIDGLVQRLVAPWGPSEGDAFPVGVGIPAAIRNGTTLTAANIDSAWIGFPAEREMARRCAEPSPSATTPTWPVWPRCASAPAAIRRAW